MSGSSCPETASTTSHVLLLKTDSAFQELCFVDLSGECLAKDKPPFILRTEQFRNSDGMNSSTVCMWGQALCSKVTVASFL